ncbi:MAG: hypothetical protein GY869_26420, partial [Planctomycetes bacterium]|nr:hypothetical protein [Planctomycetota bacterium]
VISASEYDNTIAWYENDGSGNFSSQQVITINADRAIMIFAADLDADGDPDVLSASHNDDKIAWYMNTTTGNKPPVIQSLVNSTDIITRPQQLTLSAQNVSDDNGDPIAQIEFYHDHNGDGSLDVLEDTLLGSDFVQSDGWNWTGATSDLPIGINYFFARARDNHGDWGHPAETTTEIFKNNYPYTYDWTYSIGGDSSDEGRDIAVDAAGNIYITGLLRGKIDFDHSDGIDEHETNGNADVFITKLNADGSYAWTKTFGGDSSDYVESIAVDSTGNIIVAGCFLNTVDFDPSTGIDEHTSNGKTDAYVTKLYTDGSYAWTVTLGSNDSDYAYDVAASTDGSVLVTGTYKGTVDFNPTAAVEIYTSKGSNDIFLTRLYADGSYAWTASYGSNILDAGKGVATDSENNILLTGYFSKTVDFDPTPSVDEHTSKGSSDVFVTKLHPNGSYYWTDIFGGSNGDEGVDIAVDSSDNIYLTGKFHSNNMDFDPANGIDTLPHNGKYDVFVTRLLPDSSYDWIRTFGGSSYDQPRSIAVDTSDHVYVTGCFSNVCDFNSISGGDRFTSRGKSDVFVTQFNNDGSYGWTATFGNERSDDANGIAADSYGNVMVIGDYQGTM